MVQTFPCQEERECFIKASGRDEMLYNLVKSNFHVLHDKTSSVLNKHDYLTHYFLHFYILLLCVTCHG